MDLYADAADAAGPESRKRDGVAGEPPAAFWSSNVPVANWFVSVSMKTTVELSTT
jgi:hypothetical protein